MDDVTSLALALGGLFVLLGIWMVRQESRAASLQRRIFELETATEKSDKRKGRA